MSLKDKLVSSYLAFEDHLEDDSPIHDIRSKAINVFEGKGFPTKKEEAWKYTSLKGILNDDYCLFPKRDNDVELKDVRKYFLHDIDTFKIVFIDGVYSSFLSETTHDSMDICLLSSALSKSKYNAVVEAYYNKAASQDSLTSLNTAFAKEGAYICIPKNKEVEKHVEDIQPKILPENGLLFTPWKQNFKAPDQKGNGNQSPKVINIPGHIEGDRAPRPSHHIQKGIYKSVPIFTQNILVLLFLNWS